MELIKSNYKQTEVGLIPDDWNLVGLGDIFSFYSTANYSKAQMSEDDEVGCIHYGLIHAISNSHYNLKDGIKYYVKPEMAKYEYVLDGDVIMVDASEDLEGINKSVEVFGIGNKKFISGLHTYLLRDKESILAERFKGILLNSKLVKDQMLSLAVGMKVFGVSKTQLIKIKLPIPPTLTEQKAIANALSDVDALISSLDKLIIKKKAIKQGAIQELLTPPHKGGKRLPGFSGDWEEKKLGDIGDVQMCKRIFSYQTTKRGDVPFFKIGTFGKEPDAFISWELYSDFRKKYPFPKKGFLLISASGTIGRTVEYNGEDAYYQDSNIIWIDNDGRLVTNEYLKYIFKVINYNTEGSTIKRLYNSIVKSAIFYCPPSLKEQNSIARILSDMDAGIDGLEMKKAKYHSIKQGMMQELLTGKTRLI